MKVKFLADCIKVMVELMIRLSPDVCLSVVARNECILANG